MCCCLCVRMYVDNCENITVWKHRIERKNRINKLISSDIFIACYNMEFNIENNNNKWKQSNEWVRELKRDTRDWKVKSTTTLCSYIWILGRKTSPLWWTCVCVPKKNNIQKLLGDCLDMVTVVILYDKHIYTLSLSSFTVVYLLFAFKWSCKLHGHASNWITHRLLLIDASNTSKAIDSSMNEEIDTYKHKKVVVVVYTAVSVKQRQ